MWGAVGDLGFDGSGRVLEPGCGSGNFLGFAPDEADLVGVELDETTAQIARHIYGSRATIHGEGFEDLRASDGSFDVVIGNVPFAKVTPHDPHHNRGRHALHNYFLIKSLHLTRPGGLVVALTSRYTLDARNPAARAEMAAVGDLVGALRLPARAFAASSGTDVVVDLLVLRRRLPGAEPQGPAWAATVPADLDLRDEMSGEPLAINEYYDAHPDRILGQLTAHRGMYREHELTVKATGSLDDQLAAGLDRIVDDATTHRLTFAVRPTSNTPAPTPAIASSAGYEIDHAQDGSFVTDTDGNLGRLADDEVTAYQPRVKKDRGELRRLVGLRDSVRGVLAVQVDGGSDTDLQLAQQTLADRYDDYRRLYGPINRSSVARTGRTDLDTGEEIMRRNRPRMGGFRDDPDWPLVAALETFDDETQQARPAAIFTDRVIAPPTPRLGVDTPAEAVAVCLDETGTVTLERAAELLGIDTDQARSELGDLVYEDPVDASLVPGAQYLSGNIARKIAACTAAADQPRFQDNLIALEKVLPRQLEPAEITARLGAPWIPGADIEAFCVEVLDVTVDVERLAEIGRWSARLRDGSRRSVALSSEWGTARADGITLLDASLNQRLHTVTDATENGRRVRNDAETLAARDKQDALADRFSEWVWEHPERAGRLADRYNELFSSTVLPTHDGSHLTFPGLAGSFVPRDHQRDAVARILTDGRTLLAHAVGAGKTATMVMAAMELRRLGSAAKPAVVVPNHMLEQFSREWLQLFPTAHILVADKDRLSKARRKEFVARAATGDWDGIVFTQSGFARLPLGKELMAEYLGEEIEMARRALGSSKDGKGLSVKRLERRIAQMEETYKGLLAAHAKDDGVRFEETGVDYVFCDEAHAYKNRRVDSSIDGVAGTASQRAQDLDAKLWALRRAHGPRVVTFATATPVANSMAELWVMQSYLHPDLLNEVDLKAFDSWAATFGRTHTALELSPDGSSYRMQTRFARFQNVPELLTLYRQVADVRTTEDLSLPTPTLTGGQPETVVVDPTDDLVDYVADLAARAERIRGRSVDPSEDNMLKVTGDGRRAALDIRLVDTDPADHDGGKLVATAQRIAQIHHNTRDLTYVDDHGQPVARRGSLQLVFCDVSTPAAKGWNAYDELRRLLVELGIPAESIRYMQSAKTDIAKAKLFAAARDGTIAVLVGSTETMGVGTNVQARAVAMHHLDAPWRPSDIEQREGRILRQGNQNPEVQVIRYVTEGSFDTYMWQTLERKAAFIAQVTRGDLPDRDVEDIGDQALSFAEVKALATGDPLVMEKAGVDADVARLSRLERSHHDDQRRLRHTLETAAARSEGCQRRVDQLTDTLERLVDTKGDQFAMTIDGQHHTKRVEAGADLKARVIERLDATPPETSTSRTQLGTLGGLTVTAQTSAIIEDEVRLAIPDAHIELVYPRHDWQTADPAIVVSRLERQLQRLPDTIASIRTDGDAAATEASRAEARIGQPWENTKQLAGLRRRQAEINDTLAASAEPPAVDPPAELDAPGNPSTVVPSNRDRLQQRLDAVARNNSRSSPGLSL